MNKLLNILLVLLLSLSLFACNKKEETKTETNTTVEEQLQEIVTDNKEKNSDYLDLTFMSGTVLYAEVLDMITNPEDYVDKKVKIKGLFATGQDMNNQLMFGCIVPDATACCAQGIQFVLDDTSLTYPEDYPELGQEIIIEGNFYYEKTDMLTIIRLDNATMEILA